MDTTAEHSSIEEDMINITCDEGDEIDIPSPTETDEEFDEIRVPMPKTEQHTTLEQSTTLDMAAIKEIMYGAGARADGEVPAPAPAPAPAFAPAPASALALTDTPFPAMTSSIRRRLNVEVFTAQTMERDQLTSAPVGSANPPSLRIIVGIETMKEAQLIAIGALGKGWSGHATQLMTPSTIGPRVVILCRGTEWVIKGCTVLYHHNNKAVLSSVMCINLQALDDDVIVSMAPTSEVSIYIPFSFCEATVDVNVELGKFLGDLCNQKINKHTNIMTLVPKGTAAQTTGVLSGLQTRCTPLRIFKDFSTPEGTMSPWITGLCAMYLENVLVSNAGQGLIMSLMTS